MEEVSGKGWGEIISPQKRMCAKYKGLKHHNSWGNYKYFSLSGWREGERKDKSLENQAVGLGGPGAM